MSYSGYDGYLAAEMNKYLFASPWVVANRENIAAMAYGAIECIPGILNTTLPTWHKDPVRLTQIAIGTMLTLDRLVVIGEAPEKTTSLEYYGSMLPVCQFAIRTSIRDTSLDLIGLTDIKPLHEPTVKALKKNMVGREAKDFIAQGIARVLKDQRTARNLKLTKTIQSIGE